MKRIFGRKKKMIKKGLLTDIDVKVISLVEQPANGKGLLVKDANGRSLHHAGIAQISKHEESGSEGRIY